MRETIVNKRLAWGYKPLVKIHRCPRALALGVVTKEAQEQEAMALEIKKRVADDPASRIIDDFYGD